MEIMADKAGKPMNVGDFLTDTKYYDTYDFVDNAKIYYHRILGDATGEMGPFATVIYGTDPRYIGSWYADEAFFVRLGKPWFLRGSGYSRGSGTGVFMFTNGDGQATSDAGFRIVFSV